MLELVVYSILCYFLFCWLWEVDWTGGMVSMVPNAGLQHHKDVAAMLADNPDLPPEHHATVLQHRKDLRDMVVKSGKGEPIRFETKVTGGMVRTIATWGDVTSKDAAKSLGRKILAHELRSDDT